MTVYVRTQLTNTIDGASRTAYDKQPQVYYSNASSTLNIRYI